MADLVLAMVFGSQGFAFWKTVRDSNRAAGVKGSFPAGHFPMAPVGSEQGAGNVEEATFSLVDTGRY